MSMLLLVAAALMGGNFAALGDGDYFGAAFGFAPLLHLWSIAVEEQFYLVYPLLLLGLRRWPAHHRARILALLAAISLALCIWGSLRHPVVNFYVGVTRGWELLLGALAAHGCFDFRRLERASTPLAALGLGAILGAAACFRGDMSLPGAATLLPAGGTVLVLIAGRGADNGVARLLAWRPLVFTGLASYSLYLWHLPVLVFGAYWMITVPHGTALLALLALAVIFALAGWALVEEPLRRGRWLPASRQFLPATLVAIAALAALGMVWWKSDGLPGRLSADDQRLLASATLHPEAARCMTVSLNDISAGRLCRFGAADSEARRVVLWGDSHALALLPGLEQLAIRRGFALFYAGRSACRPLWADGDGRQSSPIRRECEAYNAAMRGALERLQPHDVLLAGFWALPEPIEMTAASASEPLARALRDTSRAVRDLGARICLIRDLPVLVRPVPYGLVMAHRRGMDTGFLQQIDAAWQARDAATDATLLDVAGSEPQVASANPRAALCSPTRCQIEESGEVLFRDSNHLSIRGALRVAPALESCFASPPRSAGGA